MPPVAESRNFHEQAPPYQRANVDTDHKIHFVAVVSDFYPQTTRCYERMYLPM